MRRKVEDENRRAGKVNPTQPGIRTGNPQLEAHDGDAVRPAARQRAPRRRRRVRAGSGERRGA